MIKKYILSLLFFFTILPDAAFSQTICPDLQNAKVAFVQAQDAKLFCRIVGQGKPLIVIHGGPGLTQDYLLPHMAKLGQNNLVIFYDQRGCGQSLAEINPETISIETYVKDLEAIRQAFNFDKISILGHSWGGFFAMQYAIAHPEHVDRLILSNSMTASSEDFCLFVQEYMRRTAPYNAEIDKIREMPGFKTGQVDLVERYYQLIFRTYCYNPEKAVLIYSRMTPTAAINGTKVYEIFRKNVTDKPFNLQPALKNLRIPTLVIHGDSDPVPPITAQHLHENISCSKYVLMKNCGHFPYVEEPDLYFLEIAEFLNN